VNEEAGNNISPLAGTSRKPDLVGLLLALCTALIWGGLPVVLKVMLTELDPYTLTWFRFLAAGAVIGAIVARRHGLASPFRIPSSRWPLLFICVIGLSGNYLAYVMGLRYLSPATAQVVMQLSPMFVLLGGLVIFKDGFSKLQWLGLAVLIVGLALFFNQRYGDLVAGLGNYALGVIFVILSTILWAGFALSQKRLLDTVPSTSLLFIGYISGVLLLLPIARPLEVLTLSPPVAILLGLSVILTVTSYLCFAGALKRLDASRAGVVISLTPLLTVSIVWALSVLSPGTVDPEPLNALGLAGAAMVVVGSMGCSLGHG
jgi:drug/metabolite transporter (DMT)-like permease